MTIRKTKRWKQGRKPWSCVARTPPQDVRNSGFYGKRKGEFEVL
jgi:hypothetical protein